MNFYKLTFWSISSKHPKNRSSPRKTRKCKFAHFLEFSRLRRHPFCRFFASWGETHKPHFTPKIEFCEFRHFLTIFDIFEVVLNSLRDEKYGVATLLHIEYHMMTSTHKFVSAIVVIFIPPNVVLNTFTHRLHSITHVT